LSILAVFRGLGYILEMLQFTIIWKYSNLGQSGNATTQDNLEMSQFRTVSKCSNSTKFGNAPTQDKTFVPTSCNMSNYDGTCCVRAAEVSGDVTFRQGLTTEKHGPDVAYSPQVWLLRFFP
jgi:hypothetical protein